MDISDPSRASRQDRRNALRAVDAAFADGRITAADRAFRVTQVEAASSRGDLAMVTRDLTPPAVAPPDPPQVGASVPPAAWTPAWGTGAGPASRPPPSPPGGQHPPAPPPPPGPTVRRGVVRALVVVGVVVSLSCVLGLFGFVALVGSITDSGEDVVPGPASSAPAPPDLLAEPEWSRFLKAVEEESGDTLVRYAAVYDGYASLEMPTDDGSLLGFYRGRFTSTSRVTTPGSSRQEPIDLRALDVAVLRELRERAPRDAGLSDAEATTSHLVVMALGPTPLLIATVDVDGAGTESVRYDLDGTLLD